MRIATERRTVHTPHALNFALWVIGMVGVWFTTHAWLAMLWAFIASLHITVAIRKPKPKP